MHDLGGGSFAVDHQSQIIFADQIMRKVYELDPVSKTAALVIEAAPGTRYASFVPHPHDRQWLVALKEDHRKAMPETQAYGVRNTIVAINRISGLERDIVCGDDFYSYPGFSEDGKHICWIQCSHPDMP